MLTSGAFGYLGDYLLCVLVYASLIVHAWCFFRFFPRKRRPKLGLILGNTLILACLLGSVALAAESYIRFTLVETDSFGMSLPARRWFALNTSLNSLGCRDKEWSREKPEGVRRIAFVGDSFAYGWGIERVADRFPDRVATRLEQAVPGSTEILNVAKPGWGTGDQIQPIADIIDVYAVDEIVLCYVANDIEKLLPTEDGFDPKRPPLPVLFNPDSSCLLNHLYQRIVVPRVATVRNYHDWLADGYADKGTWRNQQTLLGEIIRLCRNKQVTLRVVLLPFIRTSGEKFVTTQLHTTLRRFFETNGVPVVDLAPTISDVPAKKLVVNGYDAHPNEQAHELFADAIWRAFYAPTQP
ncbi:MAG: SGNH/GDSL hydrolase family protein [Planctomycetes bacterium]|nr:SGNH/GDSL hydrolase family protein [Planctomycetota bacterium]